MKQARLFERQQVASSFDDVQVRIVTPRSHRFVPGGRTKRIFFAAQDQDRARKCVEDHTKVGTSAECFALPDEDIIAERHRHIEQQRFKPLVFAVSFRQISRLQFIDDDGCQLPGPHARLLQGSGGGPLGQVGAGIGIAQHESDDPPERLPGHFKRDNSAHREADQDEPTIMTGQHPCRHLRDSVVLGQVNARGRQISQAGPQPGIAHVAR